MTILALGHSIIIKDFTHTPRLSQIIPAYSNPHRASTQLHTIAIPKPYIAPSLLRKPIVVAPLSAAFVKQQYVVDDGYDPNPSYNFMYGVRDPNTGDNKSQEESLSDGVVRGSYQLEEPDGSIRRVTYTADDLNGFQARVEKIEHVRHQPSPFVKKYIAPAPFTLPAIIHTPVPNVPVVKAVPAYQAAPIYHKGLISNVLHGAHG